jgi:transcriptional regulator
LPGIIRAYPFATLITYCVSGLEANHTPFFLNKVDIRDILQVHLSKSNPLWKNLNDKAEVLVIF